MYTKVLKLEKRVIFSVDSSIIIGQDCGLFLVMSEPIHREYLYKKSTSIFKRLIPCSKRNSMYSRTIFFKRLSTFACTIGIDSYTYGIKIRVCLCQTNCPAYGWALNW